MDLRSALLQQVRGIGRARACHLLLTFGEQLDHILMDPDQAAAVAAVLAPERPMLGRRLAAVLMAQWQERLHHEYETYEWLEQERIIADWSLARRLVTVLGNKTRQTLEANPYVLAKTLPWKTMDTIGQRILGARLSSAVARNAPHRVLGALDHVIGECLSAGHTAIPKDQLAFQLQGRLGSGQGLVALAEALGQKHHRLIDAGSLWRFAGCAYLEREVRRRLDAMQGEECGLNLTEERAAKAVASAMARLARPLSDEQAAATRQALTRPFSVIAGGAGTGKTATMQAVVLAWEALGGRVHLCALSGKAALRLSQATHRLAKTIHRTLMELKQRSDGLDKSKVLVPNGTELDDRTLLIVDEASMVDLGQWARLLKAMPAGCRLVMVGDTAQLPPIGFGIVFHILAQQPTTARLTQVFRQDTASGIPLVAQAIRLRRRPPLLPFSGVGSGVSLLACQLSQLDTEIAAAAVRLGGFGEGGLGLHVVAPTNRRVAALNRLFHELYKGERVEVRGPLGTDYSVGDPVVYLENDYQRGLFNGALGTVIAVDPKSRTVDIVIDGRTYSLGQGDLAQIDLAYALTCHKLQGSQAAKIIVALEPTPLLEPSWLYTAVTRAEQQALLVGPPELLDAALQKPFAWSRRFVGIN